jgi:ATP-dependent exoDNAse (exonuclease V) beta subunit
MHLAKGLEFRAVVVMACDDEVIPLQERIETVGDDADLKEVYDTERQLLYVACTRARDQLLITSVEPASEFLDDLRDGPARPSVPKPKATATGKKAAKEVEAAKPKADRSKPGAVVKCLSVRQPWAWAIIHAGKNVENRTWPTNYRGKLAIHAGKSCTPVEYESAARAIVNISRKRPPPLDELPRGCIVGVVELVDCVENSRSKWAEEDSVHWVVRDPVPCKPRETKGMLGLFEVDAALVVPEKAKK